MKEAHLPAVMDRVRNKNKLSPMKDRDSLLKNSETKTEKTSRTKKYTKEK